MSFWDLFLPKTALEKLDPQKRRKVLMGLDAPGALEAIERTDDLGVLADIFMSAKSKDVYYKASFKYSSVLRNCRDLGAIVYAANATDKHAVSDSSPLRWSNERQTMTQNACSRMLSLIDALDRTMLPEATELVGKMVAAQHDPKLAGNLKFHIKRRSEYFARISSGKQVDYLKNKGAICEDDIHELDRSSLIQVAESFFFRTRVRREPVFGLDTLLRRLLSISGLPQGWDTGDKNGHAFQIDNDKVNALLVWEFMGSRNLQWISERALANISSEAIRLEVLEYCAPQDFQRCHAMVEPLVADRRLLQEALLLRKATYELSTTSNIREHLNQIDAACDISAWTYTSSASKSLLERIEERLQLRDLKQLEIAARHAGIQDYRGTIGAFNPIALFNLPLGPELVPFLSGFLRRHGREFERGDVLNRLLGRLLDLVKAHLGNLSVDVLRDLSHFQIECVEVKITGYTSHGESMQDELKFSESTYQRTLPELNPVVEEELARRGTEA